ncbi:MAG: GNAT family N-acetyltransferase, partial [Pseudomonadota bacterium]
GMTQLPTLILGPADELPRADAQETPHIAWREGFDAADIAELSAISKTAVQNDLTPDVFATPEWLSAVKDYPEARRKALWTLRIFDVHGVSIALAPFTYCKERLRGLRLRTLRVLGDPIADRFAPASSHAVEYARYVEAVLTTPFKWDAAILSEAILNDVDKDEIVRTAKAAGYRVDFRTTSLCPIISMETLNGDPGMTRYVKKLRQNIRRAERYLSELGNVELEKHMVTTDNVDDLLTVMLSLESHSSKRAEDRSFFFHDEAKRLLKQLAATPSPHFETHVFFLTLNDAPIAFDFGFTSNKRFYAYQGSFDKAYSQGSPGVALAERVMRRMVEEGYEAMDASRTSMLRATYMTRWPHEVREHSRIYIYGDTIRGRLYWMLDTQIRPALKKLRTRYEASQSSLRRNASARTRIP